MSITLLLADDHRIVREGLASLIAAQRDLKIVAQASNGREAVELAAQWCPDVVVMDIGMRELNGVEATRRITHADPKTRVVALSTHEEWQFVQAMMDAGARAYVAKSSATTDLLDAIRAVLANQTYLSPQIADASRDAAGQVPRGGAGGHPLTSREREVLQLLAEGKKSREIATTLEISNHTVEVHRRHIMRKLACRNVADLTRFAVREGFVTV